MKRAEGQSEYEVGRYGASLGLILVEGGDDAGLDELTRACEKLQQIDARSELTRAQFFTAWALFQVGKRSAALATLQHVLDAVDSLGQEFIVEGQRALPLLQYARAQGVGNGKLAALIEQVHVFGETAQAVLSRASKLSETEAEVQTPLRIFGFGRGRAARKGKPIPLPDWGAAATRYMLFYLLMHCSRTREQIAAVLWPNLDSSKVKANFHSTKTRLNRALGRTALHFDGLCYDIHPDLDYWFDVHEFQRLIETRSVETLQRAIDLYQDDFLVDCNAHWAMLYREVLQRQVLEAVMDLTSLLLTRRQYRQAIPVLHRGLQIDGLREDLHRQLMRALALSGQRAQAIRQYQYCTDILKRELQVEPSQTTRDLFQRVLDEHIFD
jgi:DNA-binding SARP family transcriptional activator